MLDRLMCARARARPDEIRPDYSADQAVVSSRLVNEQARDLTVIFPPWHGGGPAVSRLAQRKARQGSAVLLYELHDQILEPDVQRVRESFMAVQQAASEDIAVLVAQNGYERVRFISISLGTVALAMAAQAYPALTDAAIVVGSSNLARSMWEGRRTQHIRQQLEGQGTTLERLDEEWNYLAPKTHTAAFADKPVHMLVSQTDTIVPSQYQTELAVSLYDAGAQLNVVQTRLGHYAAAAKYCFGAD